MNIINIDICKSCKNLNLLTKEFHFYYLDCKIKGNKFILDKELFNCDSFKSNIEQKKEGFFKKLFK